MLVYSLPQSNSKSKSFKKENDKNQMAKKKENNMNMYQGGK